MSRTCGILLALGAPGREPSGKAKIQHLPTTPQPTGHTGDSDRTGAHYLSAVRQAARRIRKAGLVDCAALLPSSSTCGIGLNKRPRHGPLPVHGVISRAEYVGTVQGERVLLEVALDIEALTADWARIPVTFGEAAIGSAQSPDGTVLVRGVGEGQYELLVKGQGKHQVKLGLVIGVKRPPRDGASPSNARRWVSATWS